MTADRDAPSCSLVTISNIAPVHHSSAHSGEKGERDDRTDIVTATGETSTDNGEEVRAQGTSSKGLGEGCCPLYRWMQNELYRPDLLEQRTVITRSRRKSAMNQTPKADNASGRKERGKGEARIIPTKRASTTCGGMPRAPVPKPYAMRYCAVTTDCSPRRTRRQTRTICMSCYSDLPMIRWRR